MQKLPVLISYRFTSAFTSADIFFYNILELHSTSSDNIFLLQIFVFHRFTQIPAPPCDKIC